MLVSRQGGAVQSAGRAKLQGYSGAARRLNDCAEIDESSKGRHKDNAEIVASKASNLFIYDFTFILSPRNDEVIDSLFLLYN